MTLTKVAKIYKYLNKKREYLVGESHEHFIINIQSQGYKTKRFDIFQKLLNSECNLEFETLKLSKFLTNPEAIKSGLISNNAYLLLMHTL